MIFDELFIDFGPFFGPSWGPRETPEDSPGTPGRHSGLPQHCLNNTSTSHTLHFLLYLFIITSSPLTISLTQHTQHKHHTHNTHNTQKQQNKQNTTHTTHTHQTKHTHTHNTTQRYWSLLGNRMYMFYGIEACRVS